MFKHQVQPATDPDNYDSPTVGAVFDNKEEPDRATTARPWSATALGGADYANIIRPGDATSHSGKVLGSRRMHLLLWSARAPFEFRPRNCRAMREFVLSASS